MNDFSKHTEDFLYADDYKEPKKIEFLDVSGSMQNFRILPHLRGGESIEYPARMMIYCGRTAEQVTQEGRSRMQEILEYVIEERKAQKKYQDEINRSRNRMARTIL